MFVVWIFSNYFIFKTELTKYMGSSITLTVLFCFVSSSYLRPDFVLLVLCINVNPSNGLQSQRYHAHSIDQKTEAQAC